MQVSIPDIYFALRRAGADDETARHFCVIAIRETGGTLDTQSHKGPDTRDDSWGLFQINRLPGAHPDISVACATDLECSAQTAVKFLKSRGNWDDWYGDESQFPRYRQLVDTALNAYGPTPIVPSAGGNPLDPNTTPNQGGGVAGTGGIGGSGTVQATDQLSQGVKDFGIAVTIELVSLVLIAIGLWGLATGKDSAGATVRSVPRTALKWGKFLA